MIGIVSIGLVLVVTTASVAQGTTTEDFLVPGVDMSKLTFREGAWCRYIVADEALGQVDSTEVYIGVPAREQTPQGTAYWVEIATVPYGLSSEEGEVLKLLVREEITSFADGDSLGDYVLKLYNRTGTDPPQEEDPRRFKRLSLVVPTTDSLWVITPEVTVTTAAGRFSCTKKERTVQTDKEIPTGNVKLIKKARDDFSVWLDTEIPVFHLVKCVIERSRETQTVPRIAGIPAEGRKESTTTAELVEFGFDAQSVLPIEATTGKSD